MAKTEANSAANKKYQFLTGLIHRIRNEPDTNHILDHAILHEEIATFLWGEPVPTGNVGGQKTLFWWDENAKVAYSAAPRFLQSLDAAVLVYSKLPHTIPSDPKQAVVDALSHRARLLLEEKLPSWP
jgi:hypothetical protein